MIKKYIKFLKEIIENLNRKQIGELINELVDLQTRKGRLFIIGVGGGASNASHAVNDFRKLCGIQAFCPTDNVGELTARINDDGWENCFADWLEESRLSKIDMVMVFSVGGGNEEENVSVNIVNALKYARTKKARVTGIVGRDGGYTKKVADACVVIPTVNKYLTTPFVESFQSVLWHFLVFHPYLQNNPGKWESIELKK